MEFFNALTRPELLQTTQALLPKHRERLYPPTVVLSMFMRQALDGTDISMPDTPENQEHDPQHPGSWSGVPIGAIGPGDLPDPLVPHRIWR